MRRGSAVDLQSCSFNHSAVSFSLEKKKTWKLEETHFEVADSSLELVSEAHFWNQPASQPATDRFRRRFPTAAAALGGFQTGGAATSSSCRKMFHKEPMGGS